MSKRGTLKILSFANVTFWNVKELDQLGKFFDHYKGDSLSGPVHKAPSEENSLV